MSGFFGPTSPPATLALLQSSPAILDVGFGQSFLYSTINPNALTATKGLLFFTAFASLEVEPESSFNVFLDILQDGADPTIGLNRTAIGSLGTTPAGVPLPYAIGVTGSLFIDPDSGLNRCFSSTWLAEIDEGLVPYSVAKSDDDTELNVVSPLSEGFIVRLTIANASGGSIEFIDWTTDQTMLFLAS
jgi:hypothetical protein